MSTALRALEVVSCSYMSYPLYNSAYNQGHCLIPNCRHQHLLQHATMNPPYKYNIKELFIV